MGGGRLGLGGTPGVLGGHGAVPAPPPHSAPLPSRCCDKKSCGNRNETPSDPVIIDRYGAAPGGPRGARAGSPCAGGGGCERCLVSANDLRAAPRPLLPLLCCLYNWHCGTGSCPGPWGTRGSPPQHGPLPAGGTERGSASPPPRCLLQQHRVAPRTLTPASPCPPSPHPRVPTSPCPPTGLWWQPAVTDGDARLAVSAALPPCIKQTSNSATATSQTGPRGPTQRGEPGTVSPGVSPQGRGSPESPRASCCVVGERWHPCGVPGVPVCAPHPSVLGLSRCHPRVPMQGLTPRGHPDPRTERGGGLLPLQRDTRGHRWSGATSRSPPCGTGGSSGTQAVPCRAPG